MVPNSVILSKCIRLKCSYCTTSTPLRFEILKSKKWEHIRGTVNSSNGERVTKSLTISKKSVHEVNWDEGQEQRRTDVNREGETGFLANRQERRGMHRNREEQIWTVRKRYEPWGTHMNQDGGTGSLTKRQEPVSKEQELWRVDRNCFKIPYKLWRGRNVWQG